MNLSTQQISAIIKLIKTKNTCEYDGISTKLLKVSGEYITSPLTYICNKVFLTGIFPDRLKFSIVKPVFKKGDKMNLSNYRSISLLTSFSKVFEKALYNRHTEYFFKTTNYDFRKGKQQTMPFLS
jgi:Notch-like protein